MDQDCGREQSYNCHSTHSLSCDEGRFFKNIKVNTHSFDDYLDLGDFTQWNAFTQGNRLATEYIVNLRNFE